MSSELVGPEPEHCPGTQSEDAGKSSACEGCPNQKICASSVPAVRIKFLKIMVKIPFQSSIQIKPISLH